MMKFIILRTAYGMVQLAVATYSSNAFVAVASGWLGAATRQPARIGIAPIAQSRNSHGFEPWQWVE